MWKYFLDFLLQDLPYLLLFHTFLEGLFLLEFLERHLDENTKVCDYDQGSHEKRHVNWAFLLQYLLARFF